MTNGGPAVLAEGLEKSYGKTLALDGLDLRAEEGTVLGLLLDQPVGSTGWQALAWCIGILLVFVPLSVSLYGRVAAR